MKCSYQFGSVFFFSLAVFAQQQNNIVYQRKGNVSLVGLFSTHCNGEVVKELEEMSAAIWTVQALNAYQYIPEIEIGLSLIKICSNETIDQNSVLQLIKSLPESFGSTIGVLTTPAIYETIEPSKATDNLRVTPVEHIIDSDILVNMTVQLLTNLQWMIVDGVAADSQNVLNSFSERTSDEEICIRDELLIDNSNSSLQLSPFRTTTESSVIIIIAKFSNIRMVLNGIKNKTKLILVPTDFAFSGLSDLPKDSIVLLPSMKTKDSLSLYINRSRYRKDFFNHREPTRSPLFIGIAASIIKLLEPFKRIQENCKNVKFNSKQPCAKVVDFVQGMRENKTVLQPEKSMKISSDDIENALQVLKIKPSSNDEMFLYITYIINSNASEDLAIFQIFNLETKQLRPILLKISDNLLVDGEMMMNKSGTETERKKQTFESGLELNDEFPKQKPDLQTSLIEFFQRLGDRSMGNLKKGIRYQLENATEGNTSTEECDINAGEILTAMCRNFVKNQTKHNDTLESQPVFVWRFLTWVSINTSVGLMGVMSTLSIMFFIISRVCKGDILEGSPYFTLLLMLANVFVFASSLPYHMDVPNNNNNFICSFRINCPPLAYATLFSLLLSRSLMLASSDGNGGFVSHINGYLQSALCFFMLGVQVSFTLQSWFYEGYVNDSDCTKIHDEYKIIAKLAYDFLLLSILACCSPFIFRSKRNYKEGLLFSICVFFIIIVWTVWISLYILLPNEHKSAAVAVGLNSTATVLLICVFIPRTYLMTVGIIRDRTARSLPSLDRNILSEISEANYKSSQMLNDSVFGTITYRNCEMGLSNPSFLPSRSSDESQENSNDILNKEPVADTCLHPSTLQTN